MKKQTLSPYEVILVLDPVESLVNFYKDFVPSGVRIVISKGSGMSNARNSAIQAAQGDIVAFIDDDAYACDHWIEDITRNYNDPFVIGVGGAIKPVWEAGNPFWLPEELYWVVGCSYKGLPESKQSVRNPIGCNMSFRVCVFEEIGYFNTPFLVGKSTFFHNLLGAEEAQFSLKALTAIPSSKILYDPEAVVYHKVPKTRLSLRYLLIRSYREGYSKALIRKTLNSTQVLSTEREYIINLLCNSIPSRFARLNPKAITQLLVLTTGTSFVILGFLAGLIITPSK